MSGVMFPGFKTRLTEVKIITVSAFESRPINRKHLTAITPDLTREEQINIYMVQANCKTRQDNRIKTIR